MAEKMDITIDDPKDSFDSQDVVDFFHRVEREIAGNDLQDYLIAAGVTVALLLIVLALRGLLRKRLTSWITASGPHTSEVRVAGVIRALFSFLLIAPFYAGLKFLKFSPDVTGFISFVFFVLFTWRLMVFFSRFFVTVLDSMLSRSSSYMGVRAVSPIITFIVWAIGIVFILDNMGIKISSIVAGLGIMGVAVGLASQAVLGDFFGYLAILMDRPFKIGDAVTTANGSSGSIEQVGLKTTKLRMSTGELIVVPNGELSKNYLTNNTMTASRGRTFQFGITYETPVEKVKAIPDMVKQIVSNATDNASLTRVHFTTFADSSLLFEVQFMVPSSSAIDVLDALHAINIALMERFEAEGIDFAYPTSTLYMANQIRIAGAGPQAKA